MSPDRSEARMLATRAWNDVVALAHVTRGRRAFIDPADLYEVLGDLNGAITTLPQVFAQAAAWLATEYEAGRVTHDDRDLSPDAVRTAVHELLGDLARAGREARELQRTLDAIDITAAHLRRPPTQPR